MSPLIENSVLGTKLTEECLKWQNTPEEDFIVTETMKNCFVVSKKGENSGRVVHIKDLTGFTEVPDQVLLKPINGKKRPSSAVDFSKPCQIGVQLNYTPEFNTSKSDVDMFLIGKKIGNEWKFDVTGSNTKITGSTVLSIMVDENHVKATDRSKAISIAKQVIEVLAPLIGAIGSASTTAVLVGTAEVTMPGMVKAEVTLPRMGTADATRAGPTEPMQVGVESQTDEMVKSPFGGDDDAMSISMAKTMAQGQTPTDSSAYAIAMTQAFAGIGSPMAGVTTQDVGMDVMATFIY